MINIVVPMAGRGSRFQKEGYELPKPLIPVHGVPMVKLVIDNLRPKQEHHFVFLCLREHEAQHSISNVLRSFAPGCEVIFVDSVTEGAACTVLLAKHIIDCDDELMIANSDQWVDIDIDDYLGELHSRNYDGLIMTMKADDPKWSYVEFTKEKLVGRVVEKVVVSDEATVGIYNYLHGSDFVEAAEIMIAKNLRVNNEFYVAPAYNEMIAFGKRVGIYNVGSEYNGMHGLGIPSDLDKFLALAVSQRAARHEKSS